jgi:hypothetical protein
VQPAEIQLLRQIAAFEEHTPTLSRVSARRLLMRHPDDSEWLESCVHKLRRHAPTGRTTTKREEFYLAYQLSHDGGTQIAIGSPRAERWHLQAHWRATAACAALVALLFAAPLSRGHNRESSLSSNSYMTPESAQLEELQSTTIRSSSEARALAVLRTRFANPHCGEIIARIQLGAPVLEEGRALLRNECRL